jgi:hypothetical protein
MLLWRWKVDVGTGREMIEPKKDIFASHLVESRGSRVKAAPDQYLAN